MKKIHYLFYTLIFISFSISSIYFFRFTAEDAYITYRYAENLIDKGSLVYNIGEPINAMTSPFHVLISSAIYFITGDTVFSNKIFALFLLLVSALLVWNKFRNYPELQLLVLLLILLPSCILLWTFGGLETLYLLFITTTTVMLVIKISETEPKLKLLVIVFFMSGLGILTRYDSALFFAPLMLYSVLKAHSLKHIIIAILIGALIPVIWFIISIFYYGDIFPTPFYVKFPHALGKKTFFNNGIYILFYLIYTGILPVLFFLLTIFLRLNRKAYFIFLNHIKKMWWLYIGIVLELLYGLTIATTHMMFAFRFFVPYLPAIVFLIFNFILYVTKERHNFNIRRPFYRFAGIFISIYFFLVYQVIYTYNNSIQGLSFVGEYQSIGIKEYTTFMEIFEKEAGDIKEHWYMLHDNNYRPPRIWTFAGGVLPYNFKQSYIYEQLVSYRHSHPNMDALKMSADYIHIFTPMHGTIDHQISDIVIHPKKYFLVSSYEYYMYGRIKQKMNVYYNSNPNSHTLPNKIN